MIVALVCERYDARGGGLEQWVHAFAEGLRRRGHEVHLVTFSDGRRGLQPDGRRGLQPDGRRGLQPEEAGIDVSHGGRCGLQPARQEIAVHVVPWSDSRLERARRADAALADLDADVVHDTGVGCRCDVLHPQGGSRLANEERDAASCTWTERAGRRLRPSFWRWRAEWRALEHRQYTRHEGLVIAPSQKVIRDLHERHGIAIERMRLVPNGVDVQRFSPESCAVHRGDVRRQLGLTDETVFLFAAHNPRLKGLRPLLRALRLVHVRDARVRLLVVGRPPDRRTQRLVDRLGLGSAVIFCGFVPEQLPYYAAADAFVLPTYYDACSLTVLEAAACGLPAITTRDNGVSELMAHGRDGFVLDFAENINALAETMLALTDPALRHRIAGPARALAERHTFADSVRMIEHIYAEIQRGGRAGCIA